MTGARLAVLERRFDLRDGQVARVRFTTVADGDFEASRRRDELETIRSAVLARPWSSLDQVHGASVVRVDRPGDQAGAAADASVTSVAEAPLAIHTADCAPVALVSPEGVVAAVHAGWRGIEAGVVQEAARAMVSLGACSAHVVVGPCIRPECYEFGREELDRLARQLGPEVWGETSSGSPALDLVEAVQAALPGTGRGVGAGGSGDTPNLTVDGLEILPHCTSCDPRFFSHRARGDTGRQAMLVWMEGTPRQVAGPVSEGNSRDVGPVTVGSAWDAGPVTEAERLEDSPGGDGPRV